MSLANKQSQKILISQFVFTVLICLSSCKKEETKTADIKRHVQNFRNSKSADASNLVELARISKQTLETNKELGLESSNNRVINFSTVIIKNQTEFLEEITKTASSKLIIINGIFKKEKSTDTLNKDALYFDLIERNIEKEISLLQTIKRETTDKEISLFAFTSLKKQNRILEIIRRFKLIILNNENTQIK
ncbi:hypothetical protein ACRASX_00730 [Flavobacterium sp. TMP13]|uniref:hypothetical protein n=1 Tax=Flavobacterium sp. TMP13 TaxID=3425950 RepID=UPI003D77CF91